MHTKRSGLLLILVLLTLAVLAGTFLSAAKGKARRRHKLRAYRLTNDGAWSWFADPRAIYIRGKHKKTYVGWVGKKGDIKVTSFNHRNGARRTAVLLEKLEGDDHANPAILRRHDRRLAVFWSSHNGQTMFYRVTKYPEDISRWRPIQKLPVNIRGKNGYTYPNPVRLSKERNKVYLFWRGGTAKPTFSTTRDYKNWSKAKMLLWTPGRPYLKVDSNGKDTIHFAFTNGHPNENTTSLYYFKYRRGAFYKADGTKIGTMKNLPIKVDQVDKIWDYDSTLMRAWVHDIAIDRKGRPVIVYANFPSFYRHRYRYARWTGKKWLDVDLTKAGRSINPEPLERQYSGGITLDHENPNIVYLSRQVRNYYQIEKWRTYNGGLAWSRKRISGSRTKNVRPVSPRGLRSGNLSVIWMSGRYRHFKNYNTVIKTIRRHGRNKVPEAMFRASKMLGKAPFTVNFDGRFSKDQDGRIVKWIWHFRDGTPPDSRSSMLRHTFTKRGHYFVVLRVVDNKKAKSEYIKEIIVR